MLLLRLINCSFVRLLQLRGPWVTSNIDFMLYCSCSLCLYLLLICALHGWFRSVFVCCSCAAPGCKPFQFQVTWLSCCLIILLFVFLSLCLLFVCLCSCLAVIRLIVCVFRLLQLLGSWSASHGPPEHQYYLHVFVSYSCILFVCGYVVVAFLSATHVVVIAALLGCCSCPAPGRKPRPLAR